MYNPRTSKHFDRILKKLLKRNKQLYGQVLNKIIEIVNSDDVEHYKNLKHGMKDRKRVHLGHFVLIFRFDKTNNVIIFEDFDHHDNVY